MRGYVLTDDAQEEGNGEREGGGWQEGVAAGDMGMIGASSLVGSLHGILDIIEQVVEAGWGADEEEATQVRRNTLLRTPPYSSTLIMDRGSAQRGEAGGQEEMPAIDIGAAVGRQEILQGEDELMVLLEQDNNWRMVLASGVKGRKAKGRRRRRGR